MRLPSPSPGWSTRPAPSAGAEQFLAELGAQLIADGLPLAGGALTLAAPHPIIARRTWLWRAETGAVIEALGFGSMGLTGPGRRQSRAKSAATGSPGSAPGWCRRMLSDRQQMADVGRPVLGWALSRPLTDGESTLLRQAARFAAAPLAGLACAVDAGGAARGLSRPPQCGAGTGWAVAARDRRDHPRGPALWRSARFHRVVGDHGTGRRWSPRSMPGSTASPAPFTPSAARC